MPLCLRTTSGRIGIWNLFFFSRKGEGRRNIKLSEQRKVINNLNACMTSTPGYEPSPHWWEESALTPSFSFCFFFFVLSSVFFLFFSSSFLEIDRNASRSCNHLSTYILIVGFHGSNHMLIERTELSSVSCVLERVSIGEENCDVTLPWQQNFLITTMGNLSSDNGDGKEHSKKAIGLH